MNYKPNLKFKEGIMAIIVLVLIIAAVVFYKIWSSPKEKYARKLSKGKNQDQIKTIRFFLGTILGPKWSSDSEFENYLNSLVEINVDKAIEKLGLDETEVNEIEPVLIEGYIFDKNVLAKRNDKNKWISSPYHATWLLFSANQVYVYRKEFWADENRDNVSTLEYFYKDVTAFRTGQESYEFMDTVINGKEVDEKIRQVNVDTFTIVVPGDNLKIAARDSVNLEGRVKAMQQLLREKKNA